jgi:hypothetical protein
VKNVSIKGEVMNIDDLLSEVTGFYLNSGDFNGLSVSSLLKQYGEKEIIRILHNLVENDFVSIVFGDFHPNPHIKTLPPEPKSEQLDKLGTSLLHNSCLYPTSKHLTSVVNVDNYRGKPFELCLALGEPQLTHKSFELSALEVYRNDPRYYYRYDDIEGHISVKDEYFLSDSMRDSDQVLLESFGFSKDTKKNIYVAVFLRYLSMLSPEHQTIWKNKQIDIETSLHPDYYRISILGLFPERLSLYQAVLLEIKTINEICNAIGRKPLFKNDFNDIQRPPEFGYLLRPTLHGYYEFVHLLDKMLSDNMDRDFFNNEVSFEFEETRNDGKIVVNQKNSIHILSDWLHDQFQTDDWSEIEDMLQTFKTVRKLRQPQAHAIKENEYDPQYTRRQQELMKKVYQGLKTLRIVLDLYQLGSDVIIDERLEKGLIWLL